MSELKLTSPLVNVDWLAKNLDHPNLVILNATLARLKRPLPSPELEGIPGSRNFDLKGVFRDLDAQWPNTVPHPDEFTKQARKLGINQNSVIVVYDLHGIYSSPRAWWLFRVMGHDQVGVLDGGFPAWKAANHPSSEIMSNENAESKTEGNFTASFQSKFFADKDQVLKQSGKPDSAHAIVDARNQGRFNATTPEPREGLRGGRIPGSQNLPIAEIIKDGKMLPLDQLEPIYRQLNIANDQTVFT